MSNPTLRALWCDDIRQEVGNKPSFMGVYSGGLVLPALPITLPRLAVWLSIEDVRPEPGGALGLRVVTDAGVTLLALPPAPLVLPDNLPPDGPATRIQAEVVLGSVTLPAGCKYLRLVAEVNGATLQSNDLQVSVDPQALTRSGIGLPLSAQATPPTALAQT